MDITYIHGKVVALAADSKSERSEIQQVKRLRRKFNGGAREGMRKGKEETWSSVYTDNSKRGMSVKHLAIVNEKPSIRRLHGAYQLLGP